MAIGITGGAVAGRELYLKNYKKNVFLNALTHNIVAFDDNGIPITLEEIEKENKGHYTVSIGALGIILGGSIVLAAMLTLSMPWVDLVPKTDWDDRAVSIPILVISGVSFWHFTKFAFEKGKELDRIATIERIRNKRKLNTTEQQGND